ncbi:MAG: peptidylprolyl isomerase [archaeon]
MARKKSRISHASAALKKIKPESKKLSSGLQVQKGTRLPFLKTPLGVASAIFIACFAVLFAYFALGPLVTGSGAKAGDLVSVDYVGRFENGEAFDTSIEAEAKESGLYDSARTYEPMQFALGSGAVIPGFDNAIKGMRVGEKKTVRIPPEDAYGYPQQSLVQNVTIPKYTTIPYSELQKNGINETMGTVVYTVYGAAVLADINSSFALFELQPEVGETLIFPSGLSAVVARVFPAGEEMTLTLDANHPLAGQALVFEITLREIFPKEAALS